VESSPDEIVYSVSDSGIGISSDDLPHVFDRFWHRRQGSRARGNGLGLAITKGIVEAHGGRIWIVTSPGRGATFRFTIPLAPRSAEQHDTPVDLVPRSRASPRDERRTSREPTPHGRRVG
jgi:signal transduction histidine kinase